MQEQVNDVAVEQATTEETIEAAVEQAEEAAEVVEEAADAEVAEEATCTDWPGFADPYGDGCDWYSQNTWGCGDYDGCPNWPEGVPGSLEACCACHGLTARDPQC